MTRETEARSSPPAWLLALVSLGASGLLSGWWLTALGGVHDVSAGRLAAELRLRVDSPELSVRTFFEAVRHGRRELAEDASFGPSALALDARTRTALSDFACDGPVGFRVDETHRLSDRGLRLLGELHCQKADVEPALRADFEVMQVANGFRVVRMQLDEPPRP